jgi:hypothetical protein
MTDDHPTPFPGSYWVVPEQFLAGEYPGEVDPEMTRWRLRGLLARGIRESSPQTNEQIRMVTSWKKGV